MTDEIWVIAYGSNLNQEQLMERVGPVEQAVAGSLPGWRFVFGKRAQNGVDVYADIVPDPMGDCPAVAYIFNRSQLEQMDIREGYPRHYGREAVRFVPQDGTQSFMAQAWIATEEFKMPGKPAEAYLQRIREGYLHWGFDLAALDV